MTHTKEETKVLWRATVRIWCRRTAVGSRYIRYVRTALWNDFFME